MHVDNKGIIDGRWSGERKCINPKEILVEVEHVKAHRTKKDKNEISHFERFVTDGNEKADELAKTGAMLDEGFMAEARAEMQPVFTVWWKNRRTGKLNPKPKEKRIFVDQKREEMKHQTDWCAQANRYRCMRCGRSSKYMNIQ